MTDTPHPPDTGWLYYKVDGRGGGGKWTWHWAPSIAHPAVTDEEIHEYLIEHVETWARHAERATTTFERGLLPPPERITKRVESLRAEYTYILDQIRTLEKQERAAYNAPSIDKTTWEAG